MLGVPNEARLLGYGVSTCATCDGFFFRDKQIVVVGGGDSALEEALFLTKFGDTVTVVHRRKELRASKIMQDRAFRNEKIHFIWDSVVTEVARRRPGERCADPRRRLGRGADPCRGRSLRRHRARSEHGSVQGAARNGRRLGYLVTTGGTKTAIPGVFACGDVQDHEYRQAVTAAGSGCMAAIDTERYLAKLAHE